MAILDPETVLTQIQAALAQNDINQSIQILESLRAPDQADVFNDLDEQDQIALLPQLDPSTSADIIVVWANGLGAFLPILAVRLKIDPTVVYVLLSVTGSQLRALDCSQSISLGARENIYLAWYQPFSFTFSNGLNVSQAF